MEMNIKPRPHQFSLQGTINHNLFRITSVNSYGKIYYFNSDSDRIEIVWDDYHTKLLIIEVVYHPPDKNLKLINENVEIYFQI